jgi:calcineurin-binding protein cabin-1
LKVSRDWLLGTATTEKKRIVGLFGDRKPSNFFNVDLSFHFGYFFILYTAYFLQYLQGIWRNPIDDIDRPGSFPYHMSKTVQNLLEVLSALNDHEMLTEIGIQLAKVPDPEKKYLYNFEREQFSQQAISSAIGAAKRLLKGAQNRLQDVAMGIYSSYLKIHKSTFKENCMGPILVEAYKLQLLSKVINTFSFKFVFQ